MPSVSFTLCFVSEHFGDAGNDAESYACDWPDYPAAAPVVCYKAPGQETCGDSQPVDRRYRRDLFVCALFAAAVIAFLQKGFKAPGFDVQ